MQHYLIELAKRDNVSLKGLQLDILRNEGHNLHKEEVWAWVSQQLQEGLVDLFLVAPPCNTHSRARCQYRQHGGPRPLRDFNFPHGYPWLSDANREKVQLADELVQKSFTGCLLACERDKHFFLEHPEQLGRTAGQIPASIWDLPETAELLLQKGVRTFAIFQCEFSAPSSRPTFCSFFKAHSVSYNIGSFRSRVSWFTQVGCARKLFGPSAQAMPPWSKCT